MKQKRKARPLLAALLALLLLAALPLAAYATAAPAADVSLAIDLGGHGSFYDAVMTLGKLPEELEAVTTLTITGSFQGSKAWTDSDGNSLAGLFRNLETLDMEGYTGTYDARSFYTSGDMPSMRRIRLPAGVSLSELMFLECRNLTTLVCGAGDWQDGVIDLTGAGGYGEDSFWNCSAIEQVRLPDNIEISAGMFGGCISLKEITFVGSSPTAPSVGASAFYDVPGVGRLYYPPDATGYDKLAADHGLAGWKVLPIGYVDPVAPAEGTPHVCDFGGWQYSNEHHWKRCSCMALSDYAPHVFNSARVCTVCGYGARPKKVNPPTGVYESCLPRGF